MELHEFVISMFSSAGISTVVTLWWGAKEKRADLERAEKKEAERLKHVYFGIANQLETFCYRCMIKMRDISDAQNLFIEGDPNAWSRVQGEPLQVEADPQWTDLPVCLVDEVRTLEARYSEAGKWLADAFNSDPYSDMMQATDLDSQCYAYYGREASRIAKNIRHSIGLTRPAQEGYDAEFKSAIEGIRKFYIENPTRSILPEMRTAFANA